MNDNLPKILYGKPIAQKILDRAKEKVASFKIKNNKDITLAVVLVGNNPASQSYVKSKEKKCFEAGIKTKEVFLDENITQDFLNKEIDRLSNARDINAILIQLPLPPHLDERQAIERINPLKDADGLTKENFANLALQSKNSLLPCTPKGIIELLNFYSIPFECKNICIIGRSNIVGRPLSLILSNREFNSTVTLTHSKTNNLAQVAKNNDIIITAAGVPNLINEKFINKGKTILIDVGINRVTDKTNEKGYRVIGDASIEAQNLSKAYTPVPGGIGPLTVASLIENVAICAENQDRLNLL